MYLIRFIVNQCVPRVEEKTFYKCAWRKTSTFGYYREKYDDFEKFRGSFLQNLYENT